MTIVYNVAMVLFFIVSLALVIIILMQKKRGKGASAALTGGGGSGQTYWDKNKGSSAEGALERWTKILGAVFLILVTAIGFLG